LEIDEILSKCLELAEDGISQTRRKEKALLYAHGLKAKLKQSQFALHKLIGFENSSDRMTTTTSPDNVRIKEQVEFYCDAFWAFLYSSLDVLAQYINQVMKFDMNEKDVSFKAVLRKAESLRPGDTISSSMRNCKVSRYFANLDKYRNCSTHRRQIFIEERTHSIERTDGYVTSTSEEVSTVERIICDDPLVIRPSINQNRRIPEYLNGAYNNITNRIEQMVEAITVVR
jgi:hypothetical protein